MNELLILLQSENNSIFNWRGTCNDKVIEITLKVLKNINIRSDVIIKELLIQSKIQYSYALTALKSLIKNDKYFIVCITDQLINILEKGNDKEINTIASSFSHLNKEADGKISNSIYNKFSSEILGQNGSDRQLVASRALLTLSGRSLLDWHLINLLCDALINENLQMRKYATAVFSQLCPIIDSSNSLQTLIISQIFNSDNTDEQLVATKFLTTLASHDESMKQWVIKLLFKFLQMKKRINTAKIATALVNLKVFTNQVFEILIKDLKNYNSSISTHTLITLAMENDELKLRIVDSLLNILKKNKQHNIECNQATKILGKIGITTKEVLDILIQRLGIYNEKLYIRQLTESAHTLIVLGKSNDEAKHYVIERLLNVLKTGNDNSKQQAVAILGKLDVATEPVLKPLIQALDDRCYNTRSHASNAIISLANQNNSIKHRIVDLLLMMLQKGNDNAKEWSSHTFSKLGIVSEPVIIGLIKALENFSSRSEASNALITLGNISKQAKKEVVSKLLLYKNTQSNIKVSIEKILNELGIASEKALNDLLNNQSNQSQTAILENDHADNITVVQSSSKQASSFASINQTLAQQLDNNKEMNNSDKKSVMNSPILTFSIKQTKQVITDNTLINDAGDNESNNYQNQPSQINYIQ